MNDEFEFLNGKTVFIFGAGLSGQSAYTKLKNMTTIKGFIDNNATKTDYCFMGLQVLSPVQWVAKKEDFDFVLIASEHFENITRQLQNEFAIPADKILVLPTRITKPVNLGQSQDLKSNAYKILFLLSRIFESHQVNHYVDAGTLLGIHRDAKLIPWDDDIDIAVNAADISDIQLVLSEAVTELAELFGVVWTVDTHYSDREFGAVPKGAIRAFKIRSEQASEKLPMVDLFVKYVHGEHMDYTLSSRGLRMPSKHMLQTCIISYKDQNIRFPLDVESYLTAHYGDWRAPVKNWDLSMLKNSTVY